MLIREEFRVFTSPNLMNKKIKLLYILTKLNGLAPITYNKELKRVEFSRISFIYGVFVIVTLVLLAIKFYSNYFNDLGYYDSKVLKVMLYFAVVVAFLKASILCSYQLIYTKDLILLINKSLQLYKWTKESVTSDIKFKKYFKIKKQILYLQLFILLTEFCINNIKLSMAGIFYVIAYSIVTYAHFISLIIICFFIDGFMLLFFGFHRNMNKKILHLSQLQMSNDISDLQDFTDTIDEIYLMTNLIGECGKAFNTIFGVQMITTFFVSSVLILSSVSLCYYWFWLF